MRKGGFHVFMILLSVALVAAIAMPVAMAKPKLFQKSDDSGKEDEPEKFLPDYDKLTEGSDSADWVYFPVGTLKNYKSVMVKPFATNAVEEHQDEAESAAKVGKKYLDQWLKKQGFNLVESGAEIVFEGNVFDAWEPSGGARMWGGWMASPGTGLEVMAKDSSGKIVVEIRHKSRGSTIKDSVENGLEEIAKALSKAK